MELELEASQQISADKQSNCLVRKLTFDTPPFLTRN
jgi:hypothetical protein